jgi:hypothetical protein
MGVTRRDVLHLAGAGVAVALAPTSPIFAQTPKRGGVFRVRGEEPTGVDPHLTLSYKTMTALSSRTSPSPPPSASGRSPSTSSRPTDDACTSTIQKEAKHLLTEAGHGNGLKVALDVTPAFGPDFMDAVQLALGKWKAVGIETDLRLKEYGAFISSTIFGRFDHMAGTLFGSWTDPESYLVRRTFDVARRREIVYDLQRHLSQHVYHLYGPPPIAVAAWEPYVRDFAPNIGFDIGGRRLQAAWLDRSPDPAQEALAVLASVG